MIKCCRVVCDSPTGTRECVLRLPAEATIAAVLEAARDELGETAADWQSAAVGIFGHVHGREHVPADGDRIEVYRALPVDPRSSRRARATQSSMAPRGRSRG